MGARAADAGHHIVHCVRRAVVDRQQASKGFTAVASKVPHAKMHSWFVTWPKPGSVLAM
jgi:hypothetical protein